MTPRAFRVSCAAMIVCAAGVLAGCSQIAALAPVGGNGLAEVRFGAIDVLQQKDVAIMKAPVCAQDRGGPEVTCAGTTVDGRSIGVTSSIAADAQLVVTVGGETIFSGALAAVLDEAARG